MLLKTHNKSKTEKRIEIEIKNKGMVQIKNNCHGKGIYYQYCNYFSQTYGNVPLPGFSE